MSNVSSWQDLLREIIATPQEKQRIAEELGITPISLTRWITGESTPRLKNLQALVQTLPAYQEQLIDLIRQDFPNFSLEEEEPPLEDLSPTLYMQVIEAYNYLTPLHRTTTIYTLVLHHILDQLDPHHAGMAALIILCTPPQKDQKVRSLHINFGKGYPPWEWKERCNYFFGIESQVGNTVQSCRSIVIDEAKKKEFWYPIHYHQNQESTITYPLLREEKLAGALAIISTQPHRFSTTHVDMIRQYSNLLSLALDTSRFYNPNQIMLGVIPGEKTQKMIFAKWQHTTAQYNVQLTKNEQSKTFQEVQTMMLQEMENLLFSYTEN